MKTTRTTFTVVLVLAASLLAVEAQARGFGRSTSSHSTGHLSSQVTNSRSTGSHGNTNSSTSQYFHQGNGNNATPKLSGQTLVSHNPTINPNKLNTAGGKNLSGKLNPDKKLASNAGKNFEKFSFKKGLKGKYYPGQFWWGYGGFGWYGWGGCWNDWYCGCSPGYSCCQPWYYNPCYNVCCEYYAPAGCSLEPVVPDVGPNAAPVRTVSIVNPADTQTTLAFAVNGQTYSLEAGKTQELEVNENMVIEFDRGGENDTGRYSLSEGVYRFGSTPKGWELFRSNDALLADAVAAN